MKSGENCISGVEKSRIIGMLGTTKLQRSEKAVDGSVASYVLKVSGSTKLLPTPWAPFTPATTATLSDHNAEVSQLPSCSLEKKVLSCKKAVKTLK